MLLTDSDPATFEKERKDLRAMMERLNIDIGESTISTCSSQEEHTDTLREARIIREHVMSRISY